jgi:hypothetical protein
MKQLVLSHPVEIALGTLPDAKRRRLQSFFEALRNWDNDKAIRDRSEPIPLRGIYLIPSPNGMYVFFKPGADKITILDIANKETIEQFADAE